MKQYLAGKKLTAVFLFVLGISLPCFGLPAERKADLSVVYRAPRLAVEAHGVSLLRVLREIGAKVGFAIEERGIEDTVVNFAIHEGTVEEVLDRLLHGQNYALISQDVGQGAPQGARKLSKVVLLSRANNTPAIPTLHYPQRDNSTPNLGRPSQIEIARSYPVPLNLPMARVPDQRSSQREPPTEQPMVEDLLITHALSGLIGTTTDAAAQNFTANFPQPIHTSPQTSAVTAPVSAADIRDSMAKTTLIAQQNLQALLQGLATATESLMQTSAPVRRR